MSKTLARIENHQNLLAKLDVAQRALAEATDDWQRIDIRDYAKAIAVASEILNRRDIQVHAANLVQDAERAIAKANPPEQGKRTDKMNFAPPESEVEPIPRKVVSKIRSAHVKVSDEDYEALKAEAVETGEPLTRTKVADAGRKENRYAGITGENDWYTPTLYIEMARQVMGGIELDPASSEHANKVVRADRYFTKEENGLAQSWQCKTFFCNPPYEKGVIQQFVEKFHKEYRAGHINQAIWLVPADITTRWQQMFIEHSAALAFAKQRVKFYNPSGKTQPGHLGSFFYYYGTSPHTFFSVFAKHGYLFRRVVS